jgi:hypothetical protein
MFRLQEFIIGLSQNIKPKITVVECTWDPCVTVQGQTVLQCRDRLCYSVGTDCVTVWDRLCYSVGQTVLQCGDRLCYSVGTDCVTVWGQTVLQCGTDCVTVWRQTVLQCGDRLELGENIN